MITKCIQWTLLSYDVKSFLWLIRVSGHPTSDEIKGLLREKLQWNDFITSLLENLRVREKEFSYRIICTSRIFISRRASCVVGCNRINFSILLYIHQFRNVFISKGVLLLKKNIADVSVLLLFFITRASFLSF